MAQVIHQLVHTLSYGDAISGEVLALQRCFHEMGMASAIYAINVHSRLKGKAKHFSELDSRFDGKLVLHYSLGSPLNDLYIAASGAERIMIYHNLTPHHWFEGVNQRIVDDIKRGFVELPELCRLSDKIISDSNFNANELAKFDVSSEILELTVDPKRWDLEPSDEVLRMLQNTGGINVLHVGRIAPNKCIEDIIKCFCFLNRHIDRNSKLWLVGIDTDTEFYSFALKRLLNELNLEGSVQFCGGITDPEVKSFYMGSSVYLCMSEHEGFCLPIVEAMSFGLPVIAFDSSAIPDTLGGGGILVCEKRHPEIAELIAEVCNNPQLNAKVRDAGFKRVSELSFERFKKEASRLFSAEAVSMKRSSFL